MTAPFRRAALLLPLLSILPGCVRRAEKPGLERIAILRFENLGDDPAADWMGRAFSEILGDELAAVSGVYSIRSARLHSPNAVIGPRPVSAPGISSERALALLAGANRIGYGDFAVRAGRLEASLAIEDPRTARILRVVAASGSPGDVAGVASRIARVLYPQARPFPTHNAQAIQAWVSALESSGAATGPLLERAIAADPDFGPPYRMLAEWKAERQDRAGALAVLVQGTSRGAALGEIEQARLAFEAAGLRNDPAGRLASLSALLRLEPDDPRVWSTLGETAMSRRDYSRSVEAFERALSLEPDDVNALNQLAYAAAYAGNFDLAVRSLRRYEALRPADANPLDSLGDVHLIVGRFREAADFYLGAVKKSPAYSAGLFKAAVARLEAGDRPGAEELARQYTDARATAHDPLADSVRAEWMWLSGRREEASRQLEAVATDAARGPGKEVAARAWAELTIWALVEGNRDAAAASARKSVAFAGPATRSLAALAAFLSAPSAPAAEWQARAARLFPGAAATPVGGLPLAYALVLDGRFQEAATVLQPVYQNTAPTGEDAPATLLAWALVETGHAPDALPILRFNPVPPISGPTLTMPLYFPRVFELRAKAARASGRPEEASAAEAIYRQLSAGR